MHKSYLLLLMLFFNLAQALISDSNKPVDLSAQRASINEKTHIAVFQGQVNLVQGTSQLKADELTLKSNKQNQLMYAFAKGNKKQQAHYQTKGDNKKGLLKANADNIFYYPLKNKIILKGHATIVRGKNNYFAPHIVYDTKAMKVVSSKNSKGRTTIIVHSKKRLS